MRVLILSGPGQAPETMAVAIARGIGQDGVKVERGPLVSDRPRGVADYRLVCLGVAAQGLLGRHIGDEIAEGLRQLRGLGGRDVAAFVCRGAVGGSGALRRFMAALEREGAFIRDFELLRTEAEAEAFGRRLSQLWRD